MSQLEHEIAAGARPPRVFLSYAWESDPHRDWVRDLAIRLRLDGVEVLLDRWELAPGDNLPEFMERSVRESDFVLVVCTQGYKSRSDGRQGGVGFEGTLMTAEAATRIARRKFIPVLRGERWEDCAPSWLLGTLYLDLRGESLNEASYRDLLDTLHRRREGAPPVRWPSPPADTPVDDDPPLKLKGPLDERLASVLSRRLQSRPQDKELRREALQWLSRNPQSSDFPLLLASLLRAGDDSRPLLGMGRAWLETYPQHPAWAHAWMALMDAHGDDGELRELGERQIRPARSPNAAGIAPGV